MVFGNAKGFAHRLVQTVLVEQPSADIQASVPEASIAVDNGSSGICLPIIDAEYVEVERPHLNATEILERPNRDRERWVRRDDDQLAYADFPVVDEEYEDDYADRRLER